MIFLIAVASNAPLDADAVMEENDDSSQSKEKKLCNEEGNLNMCGYLTLATFVTVYRYH